MKKTSLPDPQRKTVARRAQAREPRLPHERDESTDSQHTGQPRDLIRQAASDLKAGRADTDRAPVADSTYQRLKRRR
jgi:hypothetical protein